MRRRVLEAVRRFDVGATLEAGSIRLTDGATLPNERRALEWVLATFQARARTRREAAQVDPQLAEALATVERAFGTVDVLEVRPSEPKGGAR